MRTISARHPKGHRPISRLPADLRPFLIRNIGTISIVGVLLLWLISAVLK